MKAMLIKENQRLEWSEVPDPVIKDDEVLVKIYAAALNRADLLQREGKYPSPPGCPEWMGLEIAGKIVEVGKNVTNWKIGDRVCALLGGGGHAAAAGCTVEAAWQEAKRRILDSIRQNAPDFEDQTF